MNGIAQFAIYSAVSEAVLHTPCDGVYDGEIHGSKCLPNR